MMKDNCSSDIILLRYMFNNAYTNCTPFFNEKIKLVLLNENCLKKWNNLDCVNFMMIVWKGLEE